MQLLTKNELIRTAGNPITHNRDFSLYDGAPYNCACGSVHYFDQYSSQHFASSGASAKFLAPCPDEEGTATLIKTKNKFLMFFDKFVSIAGCRPA